MLTPTKNLAAAKGYDVTPPSVHNLSLKGRHPKREAPTDIVAHEHDDYHILAPSSVRAEPETLTRAVLEDWGRVDPPASAGDARWRRREPTRCRRSRITHDEMQHAI